MAVTLLERFESKYEPEPNSGCWLWTGSKHVWGYGFIGIGSRKDGTKRATTAHRVSYELYVGPIPAGQGVYHRCDNPACVNWAHLFIGTPLQNTRDMVRKGRGAKKLSWDEVREIRRRRTSGEILRSIAADYGVHLSMIGKIANDSNWREDNDGGPKSV